MNKNWLHLYDSFFSYENTLKRQRILRQEQKKTWRSTLISSEKESNLNPASRRILLF